MAISNSGCGQLVIKERKRITESLFGNKIKAGRKDSKVTFMNMKCFLDVAYLRNYFGAIYLGDGDKDHH